MKALISKKYYQYGFVFGFAILIAFLSCKPSKRIKSSQPWSVRMTESIMKQNPDLWMVDFRKRPGWSYTSGLVSKAIMHVWLATGEDKYYQYVKAYYDKMIDEDGSIKTYKLEKYNIDKINSGKVLFRLYQETGVEKYKKAIFLLRKQMKTHPRTNEGGFWHKKIYPYQMWLDGLYMGSPFLAQFAKTFNEPEIFDDVANQFIWMEKHARDEKTGLLYHGWDESRQQRWADPKTGLSQHFWGRGMGWYSMALVDVLDFIPEDHPQRQDIIAILNRLSTALSKFQDAETGVWYQVVDQAGREGNYLESSASSMYIYTLFKAVKKGYDGILNQFIEVDENGLINIHKACAVAGLGGKPYRDGSYEYYISTEIRSNDPKAVGPFVLASLEFEALEREAK